MTKRLSALLSLSFTFVFPVLATADIITTFSDPSVQNSNTAIMDAALGITGYEIEDFEDTTLIPNLSYSLDNQSFGALPRTYVPSSTEIQSSVIWDGQRVLLGNTRNSFPSEGTRASEVTFNIQGGTNSLGIGLSSFQSLSSPGNQFPVTDHDLYINGAKIGKIEDIAGANWTPGLNRNAYLKIDATGSDSIHSVSFVNIDTSDAVDLLIFDHLAVSTVAVPEPGTFGAMTGLLAMTWLIRKKKRKKTKRNDGE